MTKYDTTYYDEVNQIPDSVFELLGCNHSFFFEKDFLNAFAQANSALEHRYLIISAKDTPLALIIIQRVNVALDSTPEKVTIQNRITRSLSCYLNNKKINIAVCGNLFLSGNYGVFIKEGAHAPLLYEHIALEMKPLQTQKKASVFFIKDFKNKELACLCKVKSHQFRAFQVEPNMRLELMWDSFEAYKNSLRSKYRVKINKADNKSSVLTVQPFEATDIKKHKSKLQELHGNITDRAMFKTINLNVDTYALLKVRFRESVHINTYWYQDTMVGFATAFHVGRQLHAHFIGLDYEINKKLSIYPRILNDYVRLGIMLDCAEVNFGRTSSEIKSTLGARPEHLTCFVRHRRTIANLFFKPLVRQIKMTEYKEHKPFKKL